LKKGLNTEEQESEYQNIGVWNEYINKTAQKRNVCIINQTEYKNIITRNEIVIDLAQKYVRSNNLNKTIIQKINIVQLWKQIYLPIELIGSKGNSKTEAYEHINKKVS